MLESRIFIGTCQSKIAVILRNSNQFYSFKKKKQFLKSKRSVILMRNIFKNLNKWFSSCSLNHFISTFITHKYPVMIRNENQYKCTIRFKSFYYFSLYLQARFSPKSIIINIERNRYSKHVLRLSLFQMKLVHISTRLAN